MKMFTFVLLAAMGMSGQQAKLAMTFSQCLQKADAEFAVRVKSMPALTDAEARRLGYDSVMKCAELIHEGDLGYKVCVGCYEQPVDVPAVQETVTIHPDAINRPCRPQEFSSSGLCFDWPLPHKDKAWTCTDPSRSLETSVDGKLHWCHRMQQ